MITARSAIAVPLPPVRREGVTLYLVGTGSLILYDPHGLKRRAHTVNDACVDPALPLQPIAAAGRCWLRGRYLTYATEDALRAIDASITKRFLRQVMHMVPERLPILGAVTPTAHMLRLRGARPSFLGGDTMTAFAPWAVMVPVVYDADRLDAAMVEHAYTFAGADIGVGMGRLAIGGAHGGFTVAARAPFTVTEVL